MGKKSREKKERKFVSKERYREKAVERKSRGRTAVLVPDGVEELEIKAFTKKLNFVPYQVTEKGHPVAKVGEYAIYRDYWIHRNVGGPEGKSRVCLRSWGLKCPICDERDTLDWKEDKALKATLKPQHKFLANFLEEGDDEVVYVDFSFANFMQKIEEEIMQIQNNEGEEAAEEAEGYLDVEDGKYVEVRFAKDKFEGHKYFKVDKVNFGDRAEDIPDEALDEAVNLDKLLVQLSYEDLLREHNGEDIEDGEEETEKEEKETEPESEPDLDEMDDDELIEFADDNDIELSKKEKKLPELKLRRLIKKRMKEAEKETEPEESEESEIPEGMKECPACEGSGKNSKGKKCKPCKGTGYLPEKEDEEEEEEEEESNEKGKREKGKNKCPHGYAFGKDCDEKDECDNCEMWDDCLDAK